mmetsp:Transcript_5528/g.12074  ORF Transcript_5528/g.12074 Transcript_5528/m.12074 type:complete len:205 (+) Transcript_5528:210-824(+)|eukprot:CAMPEP_0171370560 /NCGR_PEP_ID=MMETSP0879-20121228/8106_1 /TAXON_ID=67004 /ORGANISM="Thalassiosira weissflogii, Strain CCMP1336" /LENGTH=204 /DNA_ID=CAMNT_0011879045 /DNA_START=199 /DNA_END=813 /DNA_ORIENTATION=+
MSTKQHPGIDDENLRRKCQQAVERLVQLKINFLALDFDQTLISIHTGGRWKGTPTELLSHLRPVFSHLIRLASRQNIHIAIVTFSPQTNCIKSVLEEGFGTELAEYIPIRGNDRTWNYEGSGMRNGKQEHMASAAEELMSRPGFEADCGGGTNDGVIEDVRKDTTLLIDDDPNNIRLCLRDGTRAIWFNPKEPLGLLDCIMRLK